MELESASKYSRALDVRIGVEQWKGGVTYDVEWFVFCCCRFASPLNFAAAANAKLAHERRPSSLSKPRV